MIRLEVGCGVYCNCACSGMGAITCSTAQCMVEVVAIAVVVFVMMLLLLLQKRGRTYVGRVAILEGLAGNSSRVMHSGSGIEIRGIVLVVGFGFGFDDCQCIVIAIVMLSLFLGWGCAGLGKTSISWMLLFGSSMCWIKYRFVHMIQTVPLATRENYSTDGYVYFQGLIALIVASKES